MGQQRFCIIEAALFKRFFYDGKGHVFGGTRGHGGFDQNQATGIDLFPDHLQALFQGANDRVPLFHIAQGLFVVIALNIYDNDIGQRQRIVTKCGR